MARVLDQPTLVLLGLGEPAEHPVEGAAQAGHLVVSRHRHLDAEPPGARHVLRGPGQPHQPPGDAPGQPPAEQPRRDHHRPHQQHGPLLQLPQQILRVAELLGHLHRAPPAAERDGRHPVAVAGDVDLPVLHPLARGGGRGCPPVGGGHGQRGVPAVGYHPTAPEHLHIRTGGPDDVVQGPVVIGVGRREITRVQRRLAHLDPQVLHDTGEDGLLVHPHQPGGGVVTQEPDEDGDHGGHGGEGQGEGGPQRGHPPGPQPREPSGGTQSSLSTYPTPRTVWISAGAPGSSSLRRRYPTYTARFLEPGPKS